MVGGRRIFVYVFLVASIGFGAAIAESPQTFRFKGYADATGRSWLAHRVPVDEAGTLDVTLTWSDLRADLNIFIKDAGGRQIARTNGTRHPETLRVEVSMTGVYVVAVKAVSGAANYVLDVTYTSNGNDPPIAGEDAATVRAGESTVIDVLANDSDPNGDPIVIVSVQDPARGSASVRRDLTIGYTPDTDFAGEDRFTYRVCDAAEPSACAEGLVIVSVADVNHPPTARDDRATADSSQVIVDVLANDSDPDGDRLSLDVVDAPERGDVVISGDDVVYEPPLGFVGDDRFRYHACDDAPTPACAEAVVTVSVGSTGGERPAPDAADDVVRTEAGAARSVDVLANDVNPNGGDLQVASVTDGRWGTTTIEADGTVRYRPDPSAESRDSFSYIACEVSTPDSCDGASVEVVNVWLERPELDNPITIDLRVGSDELRLDDTRDYILRMPQVKKTGALLIRGGGDVSIVGGYMSVASSGPNISISDGPGTPHGRVVHIEGVLIDGSSGAESDGIKINAPRTTVQLKNVRIVGLLGSMNSLHADLIQPWGGVGELRISGFTGASHYNSLYLRRENDPLMPPIGTVRIQRTNIFGYVNPGGTPDSTLRGISIGTQSVPPSDATQSVNCSVTHPIYLDTFYVDPPGTKRLGQFVYPHDKMQTAGCPAQVSADGQSVHWPALRDEVFGSVLLGPPPGGDFVPVGMAGLGYVG